MKQIILSFLFLGLLFGCGNGGSQQVVIQDITVVEVSKENIPLILEFVGQVYGYKDIPIRARVDGYLEKMQFNEGFAVRQGQLLYVIDAQPFEAEVAAQKSKVAEAKTILVKAQSDYNRYKPLAETNAVSKSDYDAALAEYEAAKASVVAAEANLEIARIKLGYTMIKSPINGIIGKTMAKVGEYVGRDPNPVILNTVSRIDTIQVEFFITENQYLNLAEVMGDMNKLIQGDREDPEGELELILSNDRLHKHKGYVKFVDRGVNSTTGAILVQATFPNPERIVRPGQYAKVRITDYEEGGVLAIPQRCVRELQGQNSVYVVNGENKIETRQISVGYKTGDYIIVRDGLKVGDKIVIDALQKVQNGMTINPKLIEFESQTNAQ
jgi:membrane fusion protein (multidrug efflux system)